jgi:hypothetical protein
MAETVQEIVQINVEGVNMQQSFPAGSSFEELLIQIRKQIRAQKVSEQILALLREALASTLKAQNVVLSHPEIERLSQIIMKEVLNKVMEQVDKGENA